MYNYQRQDEQNVHDSGLHICIYFVILLSTKQSYSDWNRSLFTFFFSVFDTLVGVMVGRLFEGISLDVKNMKSCHHSSMCLRDVEVFNGFKLLAFY